MVAEWEPAAGTLIRWPLGIPTALVRELAADDTLYTLVEGQGSENNARTTFSNAGVNMDNVVFIQGSLYSMWTRDWGPQGVFGADGVLGLADPWFDGYPWVPGCAGSGAAENPRAGARGYDEDDVLPATVASFLGQPRHAMNAYCTGGNIMTDGQGIAFSTRQMLAENAPFMSEAAFRTEAERVLGIADYRILDNPEVHGIQHIDCYAKLLDEETVLVKEVPSWHPEYACVEALATAFSGMETCFGRPYEVRRVWCAPYYGNEVAAYTNSLILNGKVLVPTFGIAADEEALATYREAMPGYEVIGFDHGSWYYYDALHCRTMGLFDPGMLRIGHRPLRGTKPTQGPFSVRALIRDHSNAGLVPGAQVVRWRDAGQTAWNEVSMAAAGADTFSAEIPARPAGTVVDYHLVASDQSGRTTMNPLMAPEAFHTFSAGEGISAVPGVRAELLLDISPNPANPRTVVRFALEEEMTVNVTVHDVQGRLVKILAHRDFTRGKHALVWSGKAENGAAVPSGMYMVRVQGEGTQGAAKVMILK